MRRWEIGSVFFKIFIGEDHQPSVMFSEKASNARSFQDLGTLKVAGG
jgi:hypothetical protein